MIMGWKSSKQYFIGALLAFTCVALMAAVNGVFANLTASGTLGVTGSATFSSTLSANGAINSNTGYQLSSAAATNHLLVGNGTDYVDVATLPAVTLPTVGTAGTYASPTSVTTDVYGRVTSITASTAVGRTCGASGCYKIDSDGTITEWGETSSTGGGDVVLTFPHALTAVVSGQTSLTFGQDNTGGAADRDQCYISATLTTTGTTVSTGGSTNNCFWQLKGW
jgi:hypothetical protein